MGVSLHSVVEVTKLLRSPATRQFVCQMAKFSDGGARHHEVETERVVEKNSTVSRAVGVGLRATPHTHTHSTAENVS